jgi:hypothetical protein
MFCRFVSEGWRAHNKRFAASGADGSMPSFSSLLGFSFGRQLPSPPAGYAKSSAGWQYHYEKIVLIFSMVSQADVVLFPHLRQALDVGSNRLNPFYQPFQLL